jgi:osmoprotectant transport system permease protein
MMPLLQRGPTHQVPLVHQVHTVASLLRRGAAAGLLSLLAGAHLPSAAAAQARDTARDAARDTTRRPIIVASKPFGESYLLAEMFAQLLERAGRTVQRRPGLGATEVAFSAIRTGAIDVYPEYVGTGLIAILGDSVAPEMREDPRVAFAHVATRSLSRFGVHWLAPLGFQNGYAIAVRRETAAQYQLRTLSDLAASPVRLTAGFTSDFIGRSDGWPGLRAAYGITLKDIRPLAPAVKYEAVATRAVDIIDGYSTDGLLAKYDLVTLTDDRHFFPPYEAAALVSARLMSDDPAAVAALASLSGRLSEVRMRAWNRAIEVERRPIPDVAREALSAVGLGDSATVATITPAPAIDTGFWRFMFDRRSETLRLVGEHLRLVLLALLAAIAVAVPLGLWLANRATLSEVVMQALGVVQTIPGLALLAFMIPVLGIGALPAFVALFVYALLPIARATIAGLRIADPDAVAAVQAMGATPRQALLWVRLPLAAPIVLSGIRTAAVLTIGTATLAAFIGGGGLGEPIVTGLGLADMRLVLSGAIPAALLAVTVDAMLALAERLLAPAHTRLRRTDGSAR